MDKKFRDTTGKIWIVKDDVDPERIILQDAEKPNSQESILKAILDAAVQAKLIEEI